MTDGLRGRLRSGDLGLEGLARAIGEDLALECADLRFRLPQPDLRIALRRSRHATQRETQASEGKSNSIQSQG